MIAQISPEQDLNMKIVKTYIADDHHLFVAGLKTVLKESKKFEFDVVGTAHNGNQLMNMLKNADADLLLLDLNMPEKDGLDALGTIRDQFGNMKIIALTNYDEVKLVKAAFKAGVDGYVLKNVGISELIHAIDEVLDGRTYVGQGVNLNNGVNINKNISAKMEVYIDKFVKKYNLTKRELEILRLIAQALSNKEIAKELYISDQTVSVHRKNIMRKLGVSNTASLIKLSYDNSLI